MNSLSKISKIGFPSIVGLGVAWLGIKFISSESRLLERKMELEIQLGAKSIKSY
ncbi:MULTISPECIES: hypothetical protein [Prochlorococcus]|uniref:hypothetical protein n=1 Tax=Prochlorococcus TaxID=1218 RepID=UPI0005338907|nr:MULTISPECIES: hypothetical protein [Prochlorococcus]KGG12786.1 hypothetical protein EV05_0457 [Prochlorococcus sp. MIT 0601]